MEMIDLQCSGIFKEKYLKSSLLEFYKSLPFIQFDRLHKFASGFFFRFRHYLSVWKNILQNEIYKIYLQIQINWWAFEVAADNFH